MFVTLFRLVFPRLHKVLKNAIYILASSRISRLEAHSARVVIKLTTHVSKPKDIEILARHNRDFAIKIPII